MHRLFEEGVIHFQTDHRWATLDPEVHGPLAHSLIAWRDRLRQPEWPPTALLGATRREALPRHRHPDRRTAYPDPWRPLRGHPV